MNSLNNVIVFDLDGVITSERAYWITAGLVLHELLYSPRYWNVHGATSYTPATTEEESRHAANEALPEAVIIKLKARSVNSNWDTCYAGVCMRLINLLASLPTVSSLLPFQPWDEHWIAHLRSQCAVEREKDGALISADAFRRFDEPALRDYTGLTLIDHLDAYASAVLGHPVEHVFRRSSPFWQFCANLFQEWYLGDELYTREYGHAPAQTGKPGCIHFEQPLLPVEQMRATLTLLREQGYVLGIATGRPGQEAIQPLKNYGLYDYFDARRIVTHDEVAQAEAELRTHGDTTPLVKPHPYIFLRAADPDYQPGQPPPPHGSFVVIGDSPSDVFGARAAHALVIAVLTGMRTPEARALLEESQPDFVITDMTGVPDLLTHIDELATIQRMQFTERAKAELLLQRWFQRHMHLPTESITLLPKPVSLNSFNGIYRADSQEYFFKTHVEEQGVLQEYYHAELLANAGYNIVRPLRTLHERGQQMVVYPLVHWPVMFDLMRAAETGDTTHTDAAQANLAVLAAAEKHECERLLDIYASTLAASTASEHAQAPIHQLFWHRLTGARYKTFYEGKAVLLPDQDEKSSIAFEDLLTYRWVVNRISLPVTLGELIERAKQVLNPARAMYTVIGHGDAHFGNVFLEAGKQYLYFDPAFAGRHSPLLDVIKPFFHNVFATWMYFPQDIARDLHLSVALRRQTVYIEHDYELSPVRQAILTMKRRHLLPPLIALLRKRRALPDDWDEVMRAALLCCPLLTVNLLDMQRHAPALAWLGLSQAVQMSMFSLLEGEGMI